MTTKIILKKSSVSGNIPDTSQLDVGEVAINLADKKLYSKTGSNEIIEIGGADSITNLDNIDYIDFDTTYEPANPTTSSLYWNSDEETLYLTVNDNVTLQVGQELLWNVKNQTGSTITNGTPVMAVGTVGSSGRILISPMDGTDPDNAKYFLGIATETILNGEDGKVTHFGKVRDIDTSSYSEGAVLYVSTTTLGAVQTTEPTSGLNLPIAFVVTSSETSGTIAVRVKNIDVNSFATSAQGTLADSALQAEDIGVTVQGYNVNTVIDSNYVHTDNNYTTVEKNKLAGIEANADVTDSTNVQAAGALMDSELDNLTAVKALDQGVSTTDSPTFTGLTVGTDTFTVSGSITEQVYNWSSTTGSVTTELEPDNGTIQTLTLTGNITALTDNFSSGQALTLHITDGGYTITWPTMTWVNNGGSAPDLSTPTFTVVSIWKVGSTLYGALVGDGS
jgi:hypothetical protein